MTDPDYSHLLQIGYSGDEQWEMMHRPEQRILRFHVAFEELPSPRETCDYRQCLNRLWTPLLTEAGLSACILHPFRRSDGGPESKALGWVWRQQGSERLASVTEEELFRLSKLLRAPDTHVTGFVLTEQITTDRRGKHQNQRKLRFSKGNFAVELPQT